MTAPQNLSDLNTTLFLIDEKPVSAKEILEVIRMQGLIPAIVRELIINEAASNIAINEEESEELRESLMNSHKIESDESYISFLEANNLDESLLMKKLKRPIQVVRYREERWGTRVKSLYLKHKNQYDLVTYNRLQGKDPDVMQEVYFRLKDGEETWPSLAMQLSGGNPASTALVGPIPVAELEEEVLMILRKLGPGEISRPIRLENSTVLVELQKFEPSVLDEELRSSILRLEFDNWLKEKCDRLLNKLEFDQ